MNRELQDYYENRFGMMATPGWQDLMDDVDVMIKATNTLDGVQTEQQLQFRKGEMSIMSWLRNLRESSSEVYEQLQQEDDNAEKTI